MKHLYYRDGSRYAGHVACNYNPAKGTARVLEYQTCEACRGNKAAPGKFPCRWCRGSGKSIKQRWISLYTRDRLDELNAKKYPRVASSVAALAESKTSFKVFTRQRASLISDIQEYALMSERLQQLLAVIDEGVALEPAEIREACRLVAPFRHTNERK